MAFLHFFFFNVSYDVAEQLIFCLAVLEVRRVVYSREGVSVAMLFAGLKITLKS